VHGLVLGAKSLREHLPARDIMVAIIANRFVFGVLTAGALLLVRGSLHPVEDATPRSPTSRSPPVVRRSVH
jgi:hypothetical protein